MTINFDLDGTLVDLYNVPNWLEKLTNSDPSPYAIAKPLVNFSRLARFINRLIANGHEVNIISWTSRNGSPTYNAEVAQTKRDYLKKHLPSVHFTNIFIVPYGTYKETLANGILFDDEENNRKYWKGQAYDETKIFQVLQDLLSQIGGHLFSYVIRPKKLLDFFVNYDILLV